MQKKEEDDDDGEDVQKKRKKKHGISLELSEARNNLKNENPNETKRKTNFAARRGCKINEGATGRVRSGGGRGRDWDRYSTRTEGLRVVLRRAVRWMSATGRART